VAVIPDVKRRDVSRLIEGRNMRCPRCKEANDVLRFVPMGMIDEFADETNPIYKCPECRWIFSPALTPTELLHAFGISQEDLVRHQHREAEG
jgi:hypothetical protein